MAAKKKAPAKKVAAKKAPAKKVAAKKAPAKKAAVKKAVEKKVPAKKMTAVADRYNKTQILTEIADNTELSKKQVQAVLDELSDVIERHLPRMVKRAMIAIGYNDYLGIQVANERNRRTRR